MRSVKPLKRTGTALTASVPAPVGGWNARDPLSEMDEKDAVNLTNFWPLPADVMVRRGYSKSCTGLVNDVNSLMPYNGGATSKLFAAAGTSFFDVTAGGTVGAAVVTSLTNSYWQHQNITTSGGSFLLAVNGHDKLRGYTGSAWYVDGDGAHDITGFDTSKAVQINLFKNRIYLIETNTLKTWYLGVNSIAGAATALNFQGVARKGGYLVAMSNWTIDAGAGVDDYAVWVTSQGEIIVYKGGDPASSTDWALVGVWELGSPLGSRCMMKWAGDLLIMTQDGLLPLSGALQSSRLNPRVALTDKIQSAVSEAATNYGSSQGWQLLYYAKANMLMVNIPVSSTAPEQYVMNTITKAWANFTGWNAKCWCIFNDEPYFGGAGYVGKAWSTSSDNATNIVATASQAYSYFGAKGIQKRFTMARPIFLSEGTPSVSASLNVDFNESTPVALSFVPTTFATWDSGKWDQAIWGGSLSVSKSWQGLSGIGCAASISLKTATQGIDTRWVSTDFVFERGGVL